MVDIRKPSDYNVDMSILAKDYEEYSTTISLPRECATILYGVLFREYSTLSNQLSEPDFFVDAEYYRNLSYEKAAVKECLERLNLDLDFHFVHGDK